MEDTKLYPPDDTKTTVEDLDDYLRKLGDDYIFRSQSKADTLTTSIERACNKFGYKLDNDAPKIEKQMFRQFARVYDGTDSDMVQKDKLYCLSLMRHFGAPTRLLDFTYSRYVAIYFALENAYEQKYGDRSAAIWSINVPALLKKVSAKYSYVAKLISDRSIDKNRINKTFDELYWDNKYTFVCPENPLQIHRRLNLQQSVFLCPGNIRKKFEENLFEQYEQHELPTADIRKVIFKPDDLQGAFEKYYRMNITRESLFPGLDGFAQSMRYQLWLYMTINDSREAWIKGTFQKD